MSWFKGRNDSGETSAKSDEGRSTTSSSDNLSPAARSFDDARRALRASINLESDQDKAVSLAEKAQRSPKPTAQSEPIDAIALETSEIAPSIKQETEPKLEEPETENSKPSDLGEEKEPEEDFPPLVDPKRAEDIQSILSKIGQVSAETNKIDEDTPPPPAFNVRPLGESNVHKTSSVETTNTIIVDQAENVPTPEPALPSSTIPSPAIPPMGSMSDPTLGKAEPIPASLSSAIKKATPQAQENEIPEFLHNSINKVTSNPLELEQEKHEPDATKPDSAPDKDIEPQISDHHIDNELNNPTAEPEVQPIVPKQKEEENTVDQISTYSEPSSDEALLDEILETEAPKPRARVVSDEPGLEIHNLGKTYKKTPVLKDVSLSVKRGEAVGLLGPNGAGKTTCFYMVCGLIPADFGSISLDGQDITELPMYRRARMGIGYLPQEASIFRGLTVAQNVRAVLEGVEKNRDKREAMLDSLLDEFSISHLRRSAAVALSGGERRRLEIARALASQPHFILLDEPLAGIDPIAVRDIRELVSHLKDRGLGVLITDHNVRETLGIVDRAYILHEGRVLMEGVPDDIIRNQEVRRVYLGDEFSR